MAKKRLTLGLIYALLAFRLEAVNVSFLVVETGLPMESAVKEQSGLWESGLLDVFFEAGHIVSNAPVLRLSERPVVVFPEEARAELAEALEGGAEFFILALLDYASPTEDAANIGKPQNISLRVFKIRPEKLLYERQYAGTTSTNLKDEYDSVKKAVRDLVPYLNDK